LAASTPVAIRMAVVLRAPSTPTKPLICPGSTANGSDSSAIVSPYRLPMWSSSSIAAPVDPTISHRLAVPLADVVQLQHRCPR
jgi:hypothetical protein